MLRWNITIVDTIHLKGNKFGMGENIKATVDSKLNDSPAVDTVLNVTKLLIIMTQTVENRTIVCKII